MPEIADATMSAAERGLEIARGDPGLAHVVFLLAKVSLAAREQNFTAALSDAGVATPPEPGVYDVVAGFTDAIDAELRTFATRSDIGEIAQLAAAETLTARLTERTGGLLFGTTSSDVQRAVREGSTKAGFASLAHDFFGRFTYRYLAYHLGRELSNHVGANGRFANTNEHGEFNRQLRTHCRQAALIIREFAAGWYSKSNFEGGITLRKARGFCDHALTKLRKELKFRGERDV